MLVDLFRCARELEIIHAGQQAVSHSGARGQPASGFLQSGVFRALWLAALVSNIGTWMQTVGAQWLLVHQPHARLLVALVQTAETLPNVLFAYVGGVLADTFDRRWLLIIVQGCLVLTGLALTLLTISGQMPPALLLTLTFVLGAGSAFSLPAYQSLIPDLIPRSELTSASALSSININRGDRVGALSRWRARAPLCGVLRRPLVGRAPEATQ